MSKRLDILTASLAKKKAELDRRFAEHFTDVRSANGQPVNDKRNGNSTIVRWERQSEAIRNLEKSIEKTEAAIEREQNKIGDCEIACETLPVAILERMDSGELIQWRKFPNRFFVPGVQKARIVWDNKRGLCTSYESYISDPAQRVKFQRVIDQLLVELKARP